MDFKLECVAIDSCKDLSIQLIASANVQIHCHDQNACDGIQIVSDTDAIEIFMYSFSSYVSITVPNEFIDSNLHCNPNNGYLLLDGTSFTTLENSAKDLFGGGMPCEDIIYSFNEEDKVDCEIR